jgi:tubulin monoglycylase TTLL3/8
MLALAESNAIEVGSAEVRADEAIWWFNQTVQVNVPSIARVFDSFRSMQSLARLQRYGDVRHQAALKIQGLRKVRLAIRYLRRLKRLRMLIKLQAMIKMHICRKRYRRMIRRRRMIRKVIKAIRSYIFRKRI